MTAAASIEEDALRVCFATPIERISPKTDDRRPAPRYVIYSPLDGGSAPKLVKYLTQLLELQKRSTLALRVQTAKYPIMRHRRAVYDLLDFADEAAEHNLDEVDIRRTLRDVIRRLSKRCCATLQKRSADNGGVPYLTVSTRYADAKRHTSEWQLSGSLAS